MMGSLYIETRASAAFSLPAESTHSSQGLEAQILSHSQTEVGLGVEGSSAVTMPEIDILRVILDRGGASGLWRRDAKVLPDPQHLATTHRGHPNPPAGSFRSRAALCASPVSDRGGLRRLHRPRGVELPVAIFNATSPLVPRNNHADMVRASAFACRGDLLLRLAVCQGKDLIAEGQRGALAASWFCGGRARTPT
jgi:hypothetical protein